VYVSYSMAQQNSSGLGRLIVEVSVSHTHSVGLLWSSDQLFAEVDTFTIHRKYKWRTFMPSATFKAAIPAVKRLQTSALHRMATGILFCVY